MNRSGSPSIVLHDPATSCFCTISLTGHRALTWKRHFRFFIAKTQRREDAKKMQCDCFFFFASSKISRRFFASSHGRNLEARPAVHPFPLCAHCAPAPSARKDHAGIAQRAQRHRGHREENRANNFLWRRTCRCARSPRWVLREEGAGDCRRTMPAHEEFAHRWCDANYKCPHPWTTDE